jgi:outer membrane biosynthesis protein TonB
MKNLIIVIFNCNLSALVATKDDIVQEDFHEIEPKKEPTPDPNHLPKPKEEPKPDHNHLSKPKEEPKPDPIHISKPKQHPKTYTCCNNTPHKTFPGIDHYFKNIPKRLSSSEASSGDDDDNDVVVTSKN